MLASLLDGFLCYSPAYVSFRRNERLFHERSTSKSLIFVSASFIGFLLRQKHPERSTKYPFLSYIRFLLVSSLVHGRKSPRNIPRSSQSLYFDLILHVSHFTTVYVMLCRVMSLVEIQGTNLIVVLIREYLYFCSY